MQRRFTKLASLLVPLDRANVDTDAILPKQYLKSIQRTGFGPYLFDELRYLDAGQPGQDCTHRPRNPDFSLNDPRYQGAQILLARENFGCGSSREHAVWALHDWGIRALIAPSYADIFYGNCFRNGMLPVVLPAEIVDRLFRELTAQPDFVVSIDLAEQSVTLPFCEVLHFEIDAFRKRCLLDGLDEIELTLLNECNLERYERRRSEDEPWLFVRDGS
jgi:3-isopropylmalate/(R)-2-methylmalate dehydratase small subunit